MSLKLIIKKLEICTGAQMILRKVPIKNKFTMKEIGNLLADSQSILNR
jgi:hypothetical protein